MKILVTGSNGLVGTAIDAAATTAGHAVVGFDLAQSDDVLNPGALIKAAESCDSIIHCAALLGHPADTPSKIMEVNVQGTWNVLAAALEKGISKVVFLSSVDVVGIFKGERTPDFLPLDESHPCYPGTPYAMSKYLAEEMCRLSCATYDMSIVCLRPPGVWQAPTTYEWILEERRKRPAFEWDPFWEYGAFIDVRDLASACLSALSPSVTGFHQLFVAADDITTSGQTSQHLSHQLHPTVPWRGGTEFTKAPYRTLLSNTKAKQELNWVPTHTWQNFTNEQQTQDKRG